MGGDGYSAENKLASNKGIEMLKGLPGATGSKKTTDVLQKYGAGGMSLQDALQAMKYGSDPSYKQGFVDQAAQLQKLISGVEGAGLAGEKSGAGAELGSWKGQLEQLQAKIREIDSAPQYDQGNMMELFSNPLTAGKAAAEQVQGNDLFKGMFGKGGIQEQRQAEETNLATRGYSLQPEDYEAFGQASDNIARQFGTQENNLAQALASRGLSTGASGAAGVSYSGLQGNKMEQLAQSQRQIAGDRMKMNLERLNSVRGFVDSANRGAQSAFDSQKASNQQGHENYYNKLKDAVSAGQIEQGQENAAFEQREATKGPSVGEVLGGVASAGLGAVTGGLGAGVGGAIGQGLGQAINPKWTPPKAK
jgi:hypothetical protein